MLNPVKTERRAFNAFFYKILLFFLCFFLFFATTIAPSEKKIITQNEAQAYTYVVCVCVIANHAVTRALILEQHGVGVFLTDPQSLAYLTADICVDTGGTRGWIAYQFCRHREEFIVFYWFKEHVLAAMMMMSEQLVSMAMNQMFITGAFFDAHLQLETQRLFQELAAKAHKDYRPSEGMCEIGTLARSLAASQRTGEYNAYVLSQYLQRRQMRNANMGSAAGKNLDVVQRWSQFRAYFCNRNDDNGQLGATNNFICQNTPLQSRNADVDYFTTVDYPNTIDVDFADGANNGNERAVFGLASNLYGNDVFSFFSEAFFQGPNANNADQYMYLRSIVAKRSVAQNSFNAIVGMKSSGSASDLKPYMEKALEQLGVTSATDYKALIGNRPSYYAQMEFLTKKLYERPEFYTNLYDTPANVDRKKAALQALGLAQNMDLFKSKLRSEASLAVLTEMEIFDEQEQVQGRMNAIKDTGRK